MSVPECPIPPVASLVERHLQRFLRAFGRDSYEAGLDRFLDRLYWLLPLARLLQDDPFFEPFYLFAHHAVIDIRTVPYERIRGKRYVQVTALSEKYFKITLWRLEDTGEHVTLAKYHCQGEEDALLLVKRLCIPLMHEAMADGNNLHLE